MTHRFTSPAQLGFLVDELRSAGPTTYAAVATVLNAQGIRPVRGRWKAHDLYLLMRRHRRAHPMAAAKSGALLYAHRADEARRIIRRLKRRGLTRPGMIARALNARGLTTPGFGRPWTARTVARVLAAAAKPPRRRRRRSLH
jgi:hypothetical protein